jgi:hypothetical protein
MDKPKSSDARRTSPGSLGGTANGYVSDFMDETYIIPDAGEDADGCAGGVAPGLGSWADLAARRAGTRHLRDEFLDA